MGRMKEIVTEVMELHLEGVDATQIAKMLKLPVNWVVEVIEEWSPHWV